MSIPKKKLEPLYRMGLNSYRIRKLCVINEITKRGKLNLKKKKKG